MFLRHLPLLSTALLPSVVVNVIDAAVADLALTVKPLPLEAGVAATFVVSVVSDTPANGVDITPPVADDPTPAPAKTSIALLLLLAGLPLRACRCVVELDNIELEETLLLLQLLFVTVEEEEFMVEPSTFVVTSRRFRFGSLQRRGKRRKFLLEICCCFH